MSDDRAVREEDARDVEARIRARAHELWETEGRPRNRAAEHWARARREVLGIDADTSPAAESFQASAPAASGGAEAGILGGAATAASGPVGAAEGAPSLSLDLPLDAMPGTPDPLGDAGTGSVAVGGLPEGDPGAVGLGEHPSPDAARSTSAAEGDPQPRPPAPDLGLPGAEAVPTGGVSGASPSGARGGSGPRPDDPGPRVGKRPGVEQGRAGSPGTAMTIAAVALGALFLAARSRRR